MIRFKYHFLMIISIFLSLGIGLLMGLSIGEEQITSHQAQVINNLKEELNDYEEQYYSLKKEGAEMKTMLNKWENKGEKIKSTLVENLDHTTKPKLFIVSDEKFINKTKPILLSWGFLVKSKKVEEDFNEDKLKDELNKKLHDNKHIKIITSGEHYELINFFKESEIDCLQVSTSAKDVSNKTLFEFKLIYQIAELEDYIRMEDRNE